VTNHLSFELENKGRTCYSAVADWLSNFCHGFGHLLLKMESLVQKWSLYDNRKKLKELRKKV